MQQNRENRVILNINKLARLCKVPRVCIVSANAIKFPGSLNKIDVHDFS